MTSHASKPPLVFYRTGPMPCPYLSGHVERNLFTELRGVQAQEQHETLTRAGFRRSHHIVYRPACPGCAGCVPVRIVAEQFSPTRSERRVLRRNADLSVTLVEPIATDEHYAIFAAYQRDRHSDGEMAAMTFSDFRAMIEDTVVDTHLIEFRTVDGELIAGCLVDRISDAFSAVYSYYDPAQRERSLGNYMILWLVETAASIGLSHVYLGYWIEDCDKMSYKTRYRPIELLGNTGWEKL
jgi:arginine-tRNA-protein transferase